MSDKEKKIDLSKVSNLTDAIVLAKEAGLHKDEPIAEPKEENQLKLQPHDIKHHGVGKNKDGNFVHILGKEDLKNNNKYCVLSDSVKEKAGEPHLSVTVLHDGKEKSRSPEGFKNIKAVVAAIINYEKNKEW